MAFFQINRKLILIKIHFFLGIAGMNIIVLLLFLFYFEKSLINFHSFLLCNTSFIAYLYSSSLHTYNAYFFFYIKCNSLFSAILFLVLKLIQIYFFSLIIKYRIYYLYYFKAKFSILKIIE